MPNNHVRGCILKELLVSMSWRSIYLFLYIFFCPEWQILKQLGLATCDRLERVIQPKLPSSDRTQIFNCGPRRLGHPTIYHIRYWKFPFSKFLIMPTGLPRLWLPPKIAARWRYRLPIKSDTTLWQSVLCQLSFLFCPGSPKLPLNVSKLGLNMIHNLVHFKSL